MSVSPLDLAEMLSGALGDSKARQLVSDSMRQLGIAATLLELDDARKVLEHLGGQEGLVGIGARFALSRLLLANPRTAGQRSAQSHRDGPSQTEPKADKHTAG